MKNYENLKTFKAIETNQLDSSNRTCYLHSRRSTESSSSSSSSEYSSSGDERESRRSKSRSKSRKKEKKHRSKSKHSGSDGEEADGPLPLSRFFGSTKT
ncbi:hypothetical protein RJ639_011559 [Escallonia herrerae]|uniref:Uncharacterized protein n=1 Tax=Escallonia herrerae TaxID=1293975 RepID=A0AA88VN36_9ASTE|nr:hypothetical protein RJ639_011559 [Escallonia herrerae]